jgi:hypothetical protein
MEKHFRVWNPGPGEKMFDEKDPQRSKIFRDYPLFFFFYFKKYDHKNPKSTECTF